MDDTTFNTLLYVSCGVSVAAPYEKQGHLNRSSTKGPSNKWLPPTLRMSYLRRPDYGVVAGSDTVA